MKTFHLTEKIARYSLQASYEQLSDPVKDQLKKHLLDALGSVLYSVQAPAVQRMFRQMTRLQSDGPCIVPVVGHTAVDRAAQLYTLLIRYPDFMDNYLGQHATCHPSDNIGGILAVCQELQLGGREFLTSMAVAYQIECTLIDQMPLMAKGIDHTVLLASSLTAAISGLYDLTEEQAAHAIGINASTFNTTVTTRASYTYEWKGFASSLIALGCTNTVLLAKEGVTGPVSYFEGPMGFKEEFDMDPHFDCELGDFSRIQRCILKSYNAEVHTQSAIEAILELRCQHNIDAAEIERIDVSIFQTAYNIVGGGRYGDRKRVQTKEQADHSLPYLLAVAMLDGEVLPEQLLAERIRRPDVQLLLDKVDVETGYVYTGPYPDKIPARVTLHLKDGRILQVRKDDYKGFYTRPLSWDEVIDKFHMLGRNTMDTDTRNEIVRIVRGLENEEVSTLVSLLGHLPVLV